MNVRPSKVNHHEHQPKELPRLYKEGPLASSKDWNVRCTIAIPTFKRAAELKACLAILEAEITNQNPYKVIVLDNCSGDSTLDCASSYIRKIPWLSVYTRGFNVGGVRNTMEISKLVDTEFVLWLTDDDEIAPGALRILSDAFQNNGKDIDWLLSPLPTYDANSGKHLCTVKPEDCRRDNLGNINDLSDAHHAWAYSRQVWRTAFLNKCIERMKTLASLKGSSYWMIYPATMAISSGKALFLDRDLVRHIYGNEVHWECIHPNEAKRRARLDSDFINTFAIAASEALGRKKGSRATAIEVVSFMTKSLHTTPTKELIKRTLGTLAGVGEIPASELAYAIAMQALYATSRLKSAYTRSNAISASK